MSDAERATLTRDVMLVIVTWKNFGMLQHEHKLSRVRKVSVGVQMFEGLVRQIGSYDRLELYNLIRQHTRSFAQNPTTLRAKTQSSRQVGDYVSDGALKVTERVLIKFWVDKQNYFKCMKNDKTTM